METKFNVGQILEIAERLEHNGALFYVKAAARFGDRQRRELCMALADWRSGRQAALGKLKDQFYEEYAKTEQTNFDDYFQTHPEAMADLAVFSSKLYPSHVPAGNESPSRIIKDAIERTDEAITFYRGLKEFARNRETRSALDKIIAEEQCYMRVLAESPFNPEGISHNP